MIRTWIYILFLSAALAELPWDAVFGTDSPPVHTSRHARPVSRAFVYFIDQRVNLSIEIFPVRARFEKGMKEWPESYLSLAIAYFSFALFLAITIPKELNHEAWVGRYKKYYTVYRPDDERLQLFPAQYLTDKSYLKPDHPQTARDLTRFLLPPSNVHRADD